MTQLDIFAALATATVLSSKETPMLPLDPPGPVPAPTCEGGCDNCLDGPVLCDDCGAAYDCDGYCGCARAARDTREDTFPIRRTRLGYLKARIGELARKAEKLALDVAIGFEIVRSWVEEERLQDALGETYVIRHAMVDVRVFGEAPRLNGWSLLGRFDYETIPGRQMRAMVPGVECPEAFYDVPSTRCDACNAARYRKDTFLLQHEDGRYVVLGRTCLRDYLGHVSPEHIAALAMCLTELSDASDEESGFWGGFSREDWTLVEVLRLAAYSIRTVGWAPSSFEENSTRAHVSSLLSPSRDRRVEAERQAALAEVTASDAKRAENCIAWLTEQTPDGDYMHNLCAIAEVDIVTPKALGLAVSAILAYDRAMERETRRRDRARRDSDSVHVGTVKKREVFEVEVDMIRTWETEWGTTTLIKMRDSEGNILIWKASNSPEVYMGDKLRIKGTVKEHALYTPRVDSGEAPTIAQTVLTRCKIEEVVEPGPDRAEDEEE